MDKAVGGRGWRVDGVGLGYRERQALTLLASGLSPAEAARSIPLNFKYFREILQGARNKLGAKTTYQAVAIAVAKRMIEVEGYVEEVAPQPPPGRGGSGRG